MLDLLHTAFQALLTAFAEPAAPPEDGVTVAAVVYSGYDEGERDWSACSPDEGVDYEPCEVESLIRRAHESGAELIVVSEAALGGLDVEAPPILGLRPPADDAPLQQRFSDVALELGIWLVVELETEADEDHSHLTQIAYDPNGLVVAIHHKMELYRGELDSYLPGNDVTAFETPFGRVGLLICSDLYTDPRRHEHLVSDLEVDIVALSSVWTVEEAHRWQAAFAHDWGVTLIAANGAIGDGVGAGIFGPDGHAIVKTRMPNNHVVTAVLPRP